MKLRTSVLFITALLLVAQSYCEESKNEQEKDIIAEDERDMRISDLAGDIDLSALTEEQRQMTLGELDDLLADMKEALGDLNIDDAIHAQNPEDINVSEEDLKAMEEGENKDINGDDDDSDL